MYLFTFPAKQTYITGMVDLLCMRNDTEKLEHTSDLDNCMSSASSISNAIVIWLKIFTLLNGLMYIVSITVETS